MAFLLIIYFIAAAGASASRGFLLTLPAKGETTVLKEDLLSFFLDEAGGIFISGGGPGGGEPLTASQTETLIREALQDRPRLAVWLTVDPQTPWQPVASFAEMAQNLGAGFLGFALAGDSPLPAGGLR
jgi:biopolymer transport protein ExbD